MVSPGPARRPARTRTVTVTVTVCVRPAAGHGRGAAARLCSPTRTGPRRQGAGAADGGSVALRGAGWAGPAGRWAASHRGLGQRVMVAACQARRAGKEFRRRFLQRRTRISMTIAAPPAGPVQGGARIFDQDFYFHKNEMATPSENSCKVCEGGFKL
jgi:hypothetical protein